MKSVCANALGLSVPFPMGRIRSGRPIISPEVYVGPTHSAHQAFRPGPAPTPFHRRARLRQHKEFSHVRTSRPIAGPAAQRCGCSHVINSTRARLRKPA